MPRSCRHPRLMVDALIGSLDHARRNRSINPQEMIIVAAGRAFQHRKILAAVGGTIDRDVGQIDRVRIIRIHGDAAEIPGAAGRCAYRCRHVLQVAPRVVGTKQASAATASISSVNRRPSVPRATATPARCHGLSGRPLPVSCVQWSPAVGGFIKPAARPPEGGYLLQGGAAHARSPRRSLADSRAPSPGPPRRCPDLCPESSASSVRRRSSEIRRALRSVRRRARARPHTRCRDYSDRTTIWPICLRVGEADVRPRLAGVGGLVDSVAEARSDRMSASPVPA